MYTLAYSKPFITGCDWYDFMDPAAYIENGGFLRSFKGEKKPAFDRLLKPSRNNGRTSRGTTQRDKSMSDTSKISRT